MYLILMNADITKMARATLWRQETRKDTIRTSDAESKGDDYNATALL